MVNENMSSELLFPNLQSLKLCYNRASRYSHVTSLALSLHTDSTELPDGRELSSGDFN